MPRTLLLPLLIAATLTPLSCRQGAAHVAAHADLAKVPAKDGFGFNLANYTRTTPALGALAWMAAPGDAYLAIGERSAYQVQMNLTAKAQSLDGMPPVLRTDLWLDAVVFDQQLEGIGQGSLLQMTTEAKADTLTMTAIVRFLGLEVFHSEVGSDWRMNLTRDLPASATLYPSVGLGVTFAGSIGGEFGLEAKVGYRADQAMAMAVVPRLALTAGVSGKVTALNFLSAEAVGTVKIVESQFTFASSLGYHPELQLATTNIGFEAAKVSVLDGRIFLRASAYPTIPELPSDVNRDLWQAIGGLIGDSPKIFEHTVWDPPAVHVTRLPSYSTHNEYFVTEPSSKKDCLRRAAAYQTKVESATANIAKAVDGFQREYDETKSDALQDQIFAFNHIKDNMITIKGDVDAHCKAL